MDSFLTLNLNPAESFKHPVMITQLNKAQAIGQHCKSSELFTIRPRITRKAPKIETILDQQEPRIDWSIRNSLFKDYILDTDV